VLLEKLLRRQGDAVARRALASESRESRWRCSVASRDGYEAFCPNARYVRRMTELAS